MTKITEKGLQILSKGHFPHLLDLNLGKFINNRGGNKFQNHVGVQFLHSFTTLRKLNL